MSEFNLVNQEKFLNSILNVSGNIRYVMIYDLKGNEIHKRKMDGVTDLLTEEENKNALKHTIDSWNFRNSLSEKIGKANYTLQVYDNLMRVLFPFGKDMLLVVTLDNAGSPNEIIQRINTILSANQAKNISNNDFIDSMKKSFKYWSGIDEDSLINCFPVWKKILKDNPGFKNQKALIDNTKQNAGAQVESFLESWAHAIKESNFEAAKESMKKWQDLWENTANENVKIYAKVLETLEKSWENTQSKSIE